MAIIYTNTKKNKVTIDKLNVIALEYVHSDSEAVRWSYINNTINDRKIQSLDVVMSRYVATLRGQLTSVTDASGTDVLAEITDDPQFWLELMDGVARQVDQSVSDFLSANAAVAAGLSQAQSNAKFMSDMKTGKTNQKFESFMDGIYKVLHELSSLNPEQWRAFKAAYQMAAKNSGGKASKYLKFAEGMVSSWDLQYGQELVNRITQLLFNVVKSNFHRGRQMAGTMTNIKSATYMAMNEIEQDIESSVDGIVASALGSQQAGGKTQFKTVDIDIVNTHGVRVSQGVEKTSDKTYRIKGRITTRIEKLQDIATSKNLSQDLGINNSVVNLVNQSSYIDYLKRLYGSSSSGMYSVYNTITFRDSGGANFYRTMQNQVLRNSLEEFLSGRGQEYMQDLLFINGHVYSMASILLAMAKDIDRQNVVLMRIEGEIGKNEWVGRLDKPNLTNAFKRSQKQKHSLNQLKFNIQFNPQALISNFNRLGVMPIY